MLINETFEIHKFYISGFSAQTVMENSQLDEREICIK